MTIVTSGEIVIEEDANGNEMTMTAQSLGSKRSFTDASDAKRTSLTTTFTIGLILSIVLMVI